MQHLISAQRTVFYREVAAGMYSAWSFGLAQQLVEIPYLIVQSVVYSSIVYWWALRPAVVAPRCDSCECQHLRRRWWFAACAPAAAR